MMSALGFESFTAASMFFLAGEATHETLWGTVDGAWESGERAAEAALKKIGAIKEPAPAAPARKSAPRRRAPPDFGSQ